MQTRYVQMAIRVFIHAVMVCVFLLLVGSYSSLFADQATDDWLRGSGNDLHIRLKGEVFDADGQPAGKLRAPFGGENLRQAGDEPELPDF